MDRRNGVDPVFLDRRDGKGVPRWNLNHLSKKGEHVKYFLFGGSPG